MVHERGKGDKEDVEEGDVCCLSCFVLFLSLQQWFLLFFFFLS